MILTWILIITFGAGVLAWWAGGFGHRIAAAVCWVGLTLDAILVVYLWVHAAHVSAAPGVPWIAEFQGAWIQPLGITFHLALDGLSLVLVALTVVLGGAAVAASRPEIDTRIGAYYLALMSTVTGILGVFMAMDLFLFYFFWELMLVPMFFLIVFWGQKHRVAAALKFFIYTQAGGLFLLLAIIAVYWMTGHGDAERTFDYTRIMSLSVTGNLAVALGFFAAFAVKLPMVPFHVWLPDAYTEAPTAGSVLLAGLLSKTAAYAMLRFLLPLFGPSVTHMSFVVSLLAVIGILYGAVMAFTQKNIKRLVAYTSVSHLGFILLAVFSQNPMALQGAVVIMLAHGLSTGALFIITGALRRRTGTEDITAMGGLWTTLPRLGGMTLFFALASLGLPGLANFVGEFMVLAGSFQVHPWLTGAATLVLVGSTLYVVWLIFQVFFGSEPQPSQTSDLRTGEMVTLGVLAAGVLWIGILPHTVLHTAGRMWRSDEAPPRAAVTPAEAAEAEPLTEMTDQRMQVNPELKGDRAAHVRP